MTALYKQAILFLRKHGFVQNLDSGALQSSALGIATTLSGIPPKDAVLILQPLENARRRLILTGGLHPVFLITPTSLSYSVAIQWRSYERIFEAFLKDCPEAEVVADHLGINRAKLREFSQNPPGARDENTDTIRLYRRFYLAMMLFTQVQSEWPITRVLSQFFPQDNSQGVGGSSSSNSNSGGDQSGQVTRGVIQSLQKEASTFCSMVVIFCKKLNWPILASCLEDYSERLSYGVRKELLPLMRLGPDMTAIRARSFIKYGMESAHDIVAADITQVMEVLNSCQPHQQMHGQAAEMRQMNIERLSKKILDM